MALAGCAKMFGPVTTAGLSADDTLSPAEGAVIMALQSSEDRVATYRVSWARVTQEQPHTRLTPGFDVSEVPEFGRTTLVGKPAVEYHAFLVPPGKYVLDHAQFSHLVTRYDTAVMTIKPRPETVSFEVAAGETAYIGAFSFEGPEIEFSFWRYTTNRIRAVEEMRFVPVDGPVDPIPEIRAQFPNIKGPITRPALEPMTLTLPGGGSS